MREREDVNKPTLNLFGQRIVKKNTTLFYVNKLVGTLFTKFHILYLAYFLTDCIRDD